MIRVTSASFGSPSGHAHRMAQERGKDWSQRVLGSTTTSVQNTAPIASGRCFKTLCDFKELASVAEPEELQKLIRLAVRRIEWMPEGVHRVQFYYLPKTKKPLSNGDRGEFATIAGSDLGITTLSMEWNQ